MLSKLLTPRSRAHIVLLFLTGMLLYSFSGLNSPAAISYDRLRSVVHRAGKYTASSRRSQRLLFLFTSWVDSQHKSLVYHKTVVMWRKLLPAVQPGIFSNETVVVKRALMSDWRVDGVSETACGGVPTLRSMFLDAVRTYGDTYPLFGFSNGDILYDSSLLDTLRQTVDQLGHTLHTKPVLLLAKRLNVNVNKWMSDDVVDLSFLTSAGKYPVEGSSDLFITNSRFPWRDTPPLVVGRVGFGMWLVAFARARGVTVIDMTRTTRAVHMTTRAGIVESSRSVNRLCNLRLVRRLDLTPPSYRCGWVDCAHLYTDHTASGVRIQRRVIPHFCHWCDTLVNRYRAVSRRKMSNGSFS